MFRIKKIFKKTDNISKNRSKIHFIFYFILADMLRDYPTIMIALGCVIISVALLGCFFVSFKNKKMLLIV